MGEIRRPYLSSARKQPASHTWPTGPCPHTISKGLPPWPPLLGSQNSDRKVDVRRKSTKNQAIQLPLRSSNGVSPGPTAFSTMATTWELALSSRFCLMLRFPVVAAQGPGSSVIFLLCSSSGPLLGTCVLIWEGEIQNTINAMVLTISSIQLAAVTFLI